MYDILILNGRIVTGMGNPWFYGDIGVTGGAILRWDVSISVLRGR